MTSRTTSIVALSQNEISNVSGGEGLPLWAVGTIGILGAAVAGTIFFYGTPIALGIWATQSLGSYFICGDDFDKSFRKGVQTEIMGIAGALGLKLQQIPRVHQA